MIRIISKRKNNYVTGVILTFLGLINASSVTAIFLPCPAPSDINHVNWTIAGNTTAYPPYSGFVYYQKAEIRTKLDGHPIIWSVAANTPSEGRPIVTDILEGGVGVPPL